MIRLGVLSSFERAVRELGGDPEPLLARHGLTSEMMAEGDHLVTLRQVTGLLESAAEAVGCPHFTVELASRQDENLLGAIGLLMQTADTLRQALLDVEHYLRKAHTAQFHWTLVDRGDHESFEVSADLSELPPAHSRLAFELAVAQCYRVVRSVSGGQVKVAAVCFRHGDASFRASLGRYFVAPVEVGTDFDGLLFVKGVLNHRIAKADTRVHETLRRFIVNQTIPLAVDSLSEEVKVLIRPLLPTGHCTIERIARCFNCDKRTLQRALREECDTTYRQLLNEVKLETACFYLRESNLPITELAQLSGFSETTNFSRAFRRHVGMSPRDWRRRHGVDYSRRLTGRHGRPR